MEFVYVLSGSLQVDVEDERITLAEGDAMRFPGRTPHTWRNPSPSEPAEVRWVLFPPP